MKYHEQLYLANTTTSQKKTNAANRFSDVRVEKPHKVFGGNNVPRMSSILEY